MFNGFSEYILSLKTKDKEFEVNCLGPCGYLDSKKTSSSDTEAFYNKLLKNILETHTELKPFFPKGENVTVSIVSEHPILNLQ